MSTITRAVRLAVIVEAVSCVAMLYQAEPLSSWNSWAVSFGWSTSVVSDGLVFLFCLIHFPVLFLLYHVHSDVGFMIYNGRLTPNSIWLIIAMLVQCALWSLAFFGLLVLETRIRARFIHDDA
jgi:hypothetical protein